jgi:benzodiazapine receptor
MSTIVVRRSRSRWPSLVVFVALVALTASAGVMFEPASWYVQLSKPSWNPPNWIFAPVWTVLYLAIAVAGWLVWQRRRRVGVALHLWFAQLLFNWMWPFLFFGLHRIDLALIDIALLLTVIFAFIFSAYRRSAVASWLFVPAALWVGFAAALNFAIWQLNP